MQRFSPGMETPFFLAAMPQVQDPFFHRSLVLMLEHEEEGSFGIIVNRPTEIELRSILEELDVGWGGDPGALTWFGGPVQPQLGTVLFDGAFSADAPVEAILDVCPGLRFS
ncbi:MAG TPA: YqgE/AlgH family protein, partial [Thermoanaerobaculia bacterium]|nr:YqgE/AlgH family protein [Thermoanaerobaculia bacterium]